MQAGTPLSYQLEVDDGTIWFKNQNTTIGYCRYASNGDIEYIYVQPMYRLMGFGKALVAKLVYRPGKWDIPKSRSHPWASVSSQPSSNTLHDYF
jgi:GNAT superfamily N-acetyltransferase